MGCSHLIYICSPISQYHKHKNICNMRKLALAAIVSLAAASLHAQTATDSVGQAEMRQTHQLAEVVVKSKSPKIRNNANGISVTIAGSELEKVGNSKDLLARLPSIQKADETIDVYGRGAADVYVNNRKVYDLKELDRIPSDQIVNVEIISSPGARYAASTKAVVRIKTKRPQGEGWGFREEAKTWHYIGWNAREQLDVNYRQGGLDVSASLTAETQNMGSGNYTTIETLSGGKTLRQTVDQMKNRTHDRMFSPGLRLNYIFGDNQSVGAQYHYFRKPYSKTHVDLPSCFTYDDELLQSSTSRLRLSTPYYNHNANMYYSGKVKQWQIDVNLDGFWSDTKSSTLTEEWQEGKASHTNNAYNHNANRMYMAKVVLEHALWGGTLGLGGEYSNTHRTEMNQNPQVSNTSTKVDEQIASAFVDYQRMVFNRLRLQAGLRYENVTSDFYEQHQHAMNRDYADWFPSLGISLPVGRAQLSANYSIDISRPSFDDLSDNIIFINNYSYQGGNSKLKPTYNHNLSVNASWRWLWAQAFYSRIVDDVAIENVSYSETNPLVTLIHPNNIPTYHRFVVQAFAQPTLLNAWHPTWGVVFSLQDYEATTASGTKVKMNRPLTNFVWNNLVVLPHKWQVSLDFHAQTDGDYTTYRIHNFIYGLNGQVKHTLANDHLELALRAVNILHSKHQDVTIFSNRNLYQESRYYTRVEMTAVYKFNVAKSKYKGGNADSKQRQRVK